MNPIPSHLLLLPTLALGLAAQSSASLPPHADLADGQYLTGLTLGSIAFRTQLLVDGTAASQTGGLLTGLRLRGDRTMVPLAAASIPNVTVTVSETTVALGAMSQTFAQNVTGATAVVFQGTVQLPAHPVGNAGALPWDIVIPFSQPFLYLAANGNLLIDIQGLNPVCFGLCNPVYWLDSAAAGGSTTQLGQPGDRPGGDAPILWLSTPSGQEPLEITIGNNVEFKTRLAGSGPPGLLALGTSAPPQPIDLGPLGAPGNLLWIDPIFTVPHAWNTSLGFESTFLIGIPSQTTLIGVLLYAQSMIFDPNANALGVVFSAAVESRIGDPADVMRVQQLDSPDPTSVDGSLILGTALAIRLEGQFF